METTNRIAAKALTWQATGLLVMSGLGYLLTGSWQSAGSFAIGSAVLGLGMFMVHEKLWARIAWGRIVTGQVTRGPLRG